jgi:hypothetical protein
MMHEETLGPITIASCSAGFLVVGLYGRRRGPVGDETDVGSIDSHPEGASRHDHLNVSVEKPDQRSATTIGGESGVVRYGPHTVMPQNPGEGFGEVPSRSVDDG